MIRSIEEMRAFQKEHYLNKKTTGFVPTMGALHTGHLSLMKQAKQENDLGIASIFVNPTQFSPGEDYDRYPRQVEEDMKLLKSIDMDILFHPSNIEEIYNPNRLCHIEPKAFNEIYEGKIRPEFIRGVATIVCKLLNIILPTQSYFGQKDISQCILIRQMIQDLNMDYTKIKIIETLRAEDGLALSSRNVYLTKEERMKADILYKALMKGKLFCEKNSLRKEIPVEEVKEMIEKELLTEKLVSKIEYISIASHQNMKEVTKVDAKNQGAVISSAIRVGNVRLIDNLLVGKAHDDILRN